MFIHHLIDRNLSVACDLCYIHFINTVDFDQILLYIIKLLFNLQLICLGLNLQLNFKRHSYTQTIVFLFE